MATFIVQEAFEDRELSAKALAETTNRRTFYVLSSDPQQGPEDIRDIADLPHIGDVYRSYRGRLMTGLYVTDVRVKQRPEHPCEWRVDVEYSTRFDSAVGGGGAGGGSPGSGGGGAGGEAKQENPTLRQPEIRWGSNKVMRAATHTVFPSELPIKNSAGDVFDPPPEKEEVRLTLHISRNEATFDARKVFDFVSTVNETDWLGFDDRTVKCNGITADLQFESGYYFYRVNYDFEIKEDGWDLKLLDAGFNKLVAGKRVVIIDESTGRPYTTPALLDGAGMPLGAGAAPVFLIFRIFDTNDFNKLRLF